MGRRSWRHCERCGSNWHVLFYPSLFVYLATFVRDDSGCKLLALCVLTLLVQPGLFSFFSCYDGLIANVSGTYMIANMRRQFHLSMFVPGFD